MASYQTHNNGAGGFGARVDHLGQSAQELLTEARSAVTDFAAQVDLRGRVERHPYGMVAAALGIGYVLGGGLFTPLTARLVRFGLRLAALPLVKDEIMGMAGAAWEGARGSRGADQDFGGTTGGEA